MARERWPKARRSSGANQRALRSVFGSFFSVIGAPVRETFGHLSDELAETRIAHESGRITRSAGTTTGAHGTWVGIGRFAAHKIPTLRNRVGWSSRCGSGRPR